jgi:hypothetical protein
MGENGNSGPTVNLKTLGLVLGVVLTLAGAFWGVATNIVVKSDFKELSNRVREIERSIDRFFGKGMTPTASVAPETGTVHAAASEPGEPRTVVLTKQFLANHNLQPSRGGSYQLLGDDGRFYSLDDVLAILVREHPQVRHVK